jgi:hypothetical protein
LGGFDLQEQFQFRFKELFRAYQKPMWENREKGQLVLNPTMLEALFPGRTLGPLISSAGSLYSVVGSNQAVTGLTRCICATGSLVLSVGPGLTESVALLDQLLLGLWPLPDKVFICFYAAHHADFLERLVEVEF